MRKILVVISTRPEAIKMASLVHRLRAVPMVQVIVCLADQAQQALDRELAIFGIQADEDYRLARQGSMPAVPNENIAQWIDLVIRQHRPDCVLVHGHTTMALASFQQRIAADYAGAGLRMYELHHRSTGEAEGPGLVATYYFVSSETSRANLLKVGAKAENIYLTDSTAVDALQMLVERIRGNAALNAELAAAFPFLNPDKRLLLIAGHRHENYGGRLESVCLALRRLAMRPDVQVVYPVPANPKVRSIVDEVFADHPGTTLIEPQDFLHFAYLLQSAYLIVTDSHDIQEEAWSLGKPVLITRDAGEGMEDAGAGTSKLVGADAERILLECAMFLDDPAYYHAVSSRGKQYGGGEASQHIVEAMLR